MTRKLKVKTESLPARCEICHQSDTFDAARNFCSRCTNIARSFETGRHLITLVSNQTALDVFAGSAKLGIISGAMVGGVAAFCWLVMPGTPESAIVLAALAGLGGPLLGITAGLIFSFIVMIVKWLNQYEGNF